MLCILRCLVVRNECQDTYSIPRTPTSVEIVLALIFARRSNHILNH